MVYNIIFIHCLHAACTTGKVDGIDSPKLKGDTIHSGIAYMSGSDTWYDIPRMFGIEGLQPLKIHLDEGEEGTCCESHQTTLNI